jgi:uncharacterized Fe-S cluster-containing radical SAM superfamily protein
MSGVEVFLRETTAIDNETGQPCPAQVIERDGSIFLQKSLASGAKRSVLIERDAGFYKRFSNAEVTGRHYIMNHFFYVTSRCNLKCPVCFEGGRDIKEPSLETLEAELAKMRGARVELCGAEPTCRDDLPEIIRAVNRKNKAVLMSNGIRLAEMKYVRTLREAGLSYVILAMNGLTDEVYRRTNGEALLDAKLKALDNLEQAGITVFLSATITRGVNEDQIGPLLDLDRQRKCILQTRFRSMAQMGDYIEDGQFFMSEFVKVVCRQAGIDYNLWLKQQDFFEHLGRTVRIDHIRPRLCAMKADLDKDLVPFAAERDWRAWNTAAMKQPRLIAALLRNWGPTYAFQYVKESMKGYYNYAPHPGFRRISVRVWPTLDTMDLDLNRRCTSLYHRNGEVLPFCLSNSLRGS